MVTSNDRYGTTAGVQTDFKWITLAWEKIRDTDFSMANNKTDPARRSWSRFEQRWDQVEKSEAALRLTGFTGCVFAPRRCRDDQPVACQGCRERIVTNEQPRR